MEQEISKTENIQLKDKFEYSLKIADSKNDDNSNQNINVNPKKRIKNEKVTSKHHDEFDAANQDNKSPFLPSSSSKSTKTSTTTKSHSSKLKSSENITKEDENSSLKLMSTVRTSEATALHQEIKDLKEGVDELEIILKKYREICPMNIIEQLKKPRFGTIVAITSDEQIVPVTSSLPNTSNLKESTSYFAIIPDWSSSNNYDSNNNNNNICFIAVNEEGELHVCSEPDDPHLFYDANKTNNSSDSCEH